ncbi:MAG: 4-hydroxythreonine-4-phosphate dehydrogenase, partial [Campylobacteraceae bacterium]|nr:4-hydroxythreonine-4-phosphate dehydrogenase [Campylobacteraceae bacterium]MBT6578005.1 4-hydroxythreonine-4-phosphate dehydrogenase [Campylobacteraceae bacterium]
MSKKTIAISVGDINGVGLQLVLENHKNISKYCKP